LGIIEAYTAVKGKEYIPEWLTGWAWTGMVTVAILGVYSFVGWGSLLSPAILAVVVLSALALNGRLERRLNMMRTRSPRRYYR
jgi:hypothetical protein